MAKFIIWVLSIALILVASGKIKDATLNLAKAAAFKESHPMSYSQFSSELTASRK